MEYLIYSVEDDKDIAKILNMTLSKQGFTVETFYDGGSFLERLRKQKPNMILLDMMLPDLPGQEILKFVRGKKDYDDVEIIIISANHMIIDKVDGFDLGADDYIEKPFDILELLSRVNAKVRRYKNNRILKVADIVLNLDELTCVKNGENIPFTIKEFEILALLFKRKGTVVTREELLQTIWGNVALETRTIDMHIRSLRNKLDSPSLIMTIHGIGYKVNG